MPDTKFIDDNICRYIFGGRPLDALVALATHLEIEVPTQWTIDERCDILAAAYMMLGTLGAL